MTKPDDSSLQPHELKAVEERARQLLERADAWGVFPTPIAAVLDAAKLRVAPKSIFDLEGIMAYVASKASKAIDTAQHLKSAISKVFGLLDANEAIIHIDDQVVETKQNFLKLHETGHHVIPAHRKIFKIFQECEKTLSPEIADQFEREANNFARFAMFQGDAYGSQASDHALSIKTPMKLAKNFGASQYASAREFARTNHRSCVVYVLEPLEFAPEVGALARVRRIEASPSFLKQFGAPNCQVVTPDHFLWPVLPIGRRMSRPTTIEFTDRNGIRHECLAEAFDTTRNVLILVYPKTALTKTTVILPPGFKAAASI